MTLLLTLVMIIGIFAILLLSKRFFKKKYCAICGAVTITWIILLVMSKINYYTNTLIIGILAGQTIHGVYTLYGKSKKFNQSYKIPLLLTMIAVVYYAIKSQYSVKELTGAAIFLFILWALTYLANAHNHNPKIRSALKKLISCCKNW